MLKDCSSFIKFIRQSIIYLLLIGMLIVSIGATFYCRNNVLLEIESAYSQPIQLFAIYGDGNAKESNSTWFTVDKGVATYKVPISTFQLQGIRLDLITNGSIGIRSIRYEGLRTTGYCPTEPIGRNFVDFTKDKGFGQFTATLNQEDPYVGFLCKAYNSKFSGIGKTLLVMLGFFLGQAFLLLMLLKLYQFLNKYSLGHYIQPLVRWCNAHPIKTIILWAILAALISANQVIFNGKSFVAPIGVQLTYSEFPHVDQYTGDPAIDYHGSDVGATMWQHIPYSALLKKSVMEDRELPLWNRYNGGGRPYLGQGQAMVGEPLNLIIGLTGYSAFKYDLRYVFLKLIFSASIGLLIYLLYSNISAAAFLTFASAFITFFLFRVNHPAYFTIAYAPIVLLPYVLLIKANKNIELICCSLMIIVFNWMLLTSGTGKEAYLGLIFFNAIGASLFLCSQQKSRIKISILFFSNLFFALISSPLWVSFFMTIKEGLSSYADPLATQYQPLDFIFYAENIGFLTRGGYEPALNIPTFLLFISSIVLFVFRVPFRSAKNSVLLFASLLFLSIAFGLFPSWIILRIPFLNSVYHVNDVFASFAIITCLIIGGGAFSELTKKFFSISEITFFISLLISLLGLAAYSQWPFDSHQSERIYFSVFLVLLILGVLGFFYAFRIFFGRVKDRNISTAQIFVTFVLLIVLLGRGAQWPQTRSDFFHFVFTPGLRADIFIPFDGVENFTKENQKFPMRSVQIGKTMMSGYRAVHQIESLDGPDALYPKYFRKLSESLNLPYGAWGWLLDFNEKNIQKLEKELDFLNVGFIFSEYKLTLPGLQTLSEGSRLKIYQRGNPWPRAFFTSCIEYAPRENLLDIVTNKVHQGERGFVVIAEQDYQLGLDLNITQKCSDNLIVIPKKIQLSENKTSIVINNFYPGFLYLGENFEDKAFRVWVDGKLKPVIQANYAFKGVYIEHAGEHNVVFEYYPEYLNFTLFISFISLLLYLLILLIFLRLSSKPRLHD